VFQGDFKVGAQGEDCLHHSPNAAAIAPTMDFPLLTFFAGTHQSGYGPSMAEASTATTIYDGTNRQQSLAVAILCDHHASTLQQTLEFESGEDGGRGIVKEQWSWYYISVLTLRELIARFRD